MSLVEVKNVSFTYPNGFVAVDGVSFKLEKGENIAIVGQNGAGKTTTVKMLNGLTKPTSGDIIVDGKNTKEYTTAQIARTVGYGFQNTAGQDLDGLERLSRLIRELTARGKALITITHDMEFVAENFERLIIMCNKKIVADGRTDEVFYYKDIMEEAKLKQPCVVEVSDRIGAGKLGLDLEAVARFIKENRRNAAPSAQN